MDQLLERELTVDTLKTSLANGYSGSKETLVRARNSGRRLTVAHSSTGRYTRVPKAPKILDFLGN